MKKGFSFIELLIVIGIIAILGTTMAPIGSSLINRNNLRTKVDELVIALQSDRINSMTNKENSPWGVKTESQQIVIFKGNSYATRDQNFDEKFLYPKSMSITAIEIIFAQLTGLPSSPQTIQVNGPGSINKAVLVTEQGVINVQ